MASIDHIQIEVGDWMRSRDWYVRHLSLKLEFEIPDRKTAALVGENDVTLFVEESGRPAATGSVCFTIKVDDAAAVCARLAADGVALAHGPRKVFWGYGAELFDPDGYRLRLWDEASMKAYG